MADHFNVVMTAKQHYIIFGVDEVLGKIPNFVKCWCGRIRLCLLLNQPAPIEPKSILPTLITINSPFIYCI